MSERVLETAAAEVDERQVGKAVGAEVETGVLAGQKDARDDPPRNERARHGCKLDCLGASADDQTNAFGKPNLSGMQPSP